MAILRAQRETSTRPARRVRFAQGLGSLLVLAALALSLPGVRSVRAGEPDMTPVGPDEYAHVAPARPAAIAEPNEACDVGGGEHAERTAVVARLPREGGDAGFVVLNGRGYNYGSAEDVAQAQWRQLEREIGGPIQQADPAPR